MAHVLQKTGNEIDAILNKVDGVEAGAEQNVQSDWSVTNSSSDAYIKNKPSLSAVATSGSYNDLTNKPTIPTVPTNVSAFTNDAGYLTQHQSLASKQDVINDLDTIRSGATAGATAYQKPGTGIPKTDLASAVQTSLGKADTALQSFTESDPTVPSWAKASSKPSYAYSEITGTPTLADVATSGDYEDLTNTPTIPDVSGKADKTFKVTISTITSLEDDTTTYVSDKTVAQILAAYQAGRQVIAVHDNEEYGIYTLTSVTDTGALFEGTLASANQMVSFEITSSGVTFTVSELQNELVSGTNIKTVNSTSLLGSGDISVGTVTGVKMNNGSAINPTNGVVDLGTVLTSKPSYSYTEISDTPTIPTNTSDLINDSNFVTKGVYVGTCTTAAATAAKVVTVDTFPVDGNNKPLVGTTIAVKFTYTDTSTTAPTLNVNQTGAISIMYGAGSVPSKASASYTGTANIYIFYVYDGTYWCWLNRNTYQSNTDVEPGRIYGNAYRTGTTKIYAYTICGMRDDGTIASIVTSSSTGTGKTRETSGFRLGHFYYWAGANATDQTYSIAESTNLTSNYLWMWYTQAYVDLRYSTNCAKTLTAHKPVYLVGTIGNDGLFYLDSTWYTQTLPSSADGKVYVEIGMTYDTYRFIFTGSRWVWEYRDGAIRRY